MRIYSQVSPDVSDPIRIRDLKTLIDPAHTRDPSGCTAVAALVTGDGKIYVVRIALSKF